MSYKRKNPILHNYPQEKPDADSTNGEVIVSEDGYHFWFGMFSKNTQKFIGGDAIIKTWAYCKDYYAPEYYKELCHIKGWRSEQ